MIFVLLAYAAIGAYLTTICLQIDLGHGERVDEQAPANDLLTVFVERPQPGATQSRAASAIREGAGSRTGGSGHACAAR